MGSGSGGGIGPGSGGGIAGGVVAVTPPSVGTTADTITFYAASAGVPLYQSAQQLEQLSRTEKDRKENAAQIKAINGALANPAFVTGYGSIGGEEFFSYLNISDSLRRTGGEEWTRWHAQISEKILKLQNEDGTWAGSHCITGRVATTSAAMLNLTVDHDPLVNTPQNVPAPQHK